MRRSSDFDSDFERAGREIDKTSSAMRIGLVVSAVCSLAFVSAVVWAIVRLVQHFTGG